MSMRNFADSTGRALLALALAAPTSAAFGQARDLTSVLDGRYAGSLAGIAAPTTNNPDRVRQEIFVIELDEGDVIGGSWISNFVGSTVIRDVVDGFYVVNDGGTGTLEVEVANDVPGLSQVYSFELVVVNSDKFHLLRTNHDTVLFGGVIPASDRPQLGIAEKQHLQPLGRGGDAEGNPNGLGNAEQQP